MLLLLLCSRCGFSSLLEVLNYSLSQGVSISLSNSTCQHTLTYLHLQFTNVVFQFAVNVAAAALNWHLFSLNLDLSLRHCCCRAVAFYANGLTGLEICTPLLKESLDFFLSGIFYFILGVLSIVLYLSQHIIKCPWWSNISLFLYVLVFQSGDKFSFDLTVSERVSAVLMQAQSLQRESEFL